MKILMMMSYICSAEDSASAEEDSISPAEGPTINDDLNMENAVSGESDTPLNNDDISQNHEESEIMKQYYASLRNKLKLKWMYKDIIDTKLKLADYLQTNCIKIKSLLNYYK